MSGIGRCYLVSGIGRCYLVYYYYNYEIRCEFITMFKAVDRHTT